MDKRGQGSLEYLLILAAVLAVAVIVVVVANNLMGGTESRVTLSDSIYECGAKGIEFLGYTQIYKGDATTTGPSGTKFENADKTTVSLTLASTPVEKSAFGAGNELICTLKGERAGSRDLKNWKVYYIATTGSEALYVEKEPGVGETEPYFAYT